MSQQEDDLRALAKIMDFLRAVSIILVVANLYYFTHVQTVDCGGILLTGLSGSVLRLYHYRGCLLILLGILIEFNFKSVGRERLAKTGTIENIEGIMVYEGHDHR